MLDRKQYLTNMAKDTINILNKGKYVSKKGIVDFSEDLNKAIKNSLLYRPTDKINFKIGEEDAIIEITPETTLSAGKRALNEGFKNVTCLNFASATRPGGGFLKGAMAQEESITRVSGLYYCINQMNEMYEYNKKIKTGLYSDYIIYSPAVPIIKNEKGEVLDEYYKISIITSPSANKKRMLVLESDKISQIEKVMKQRIDKILAIAVQNNSEAIILGAFGCGVFANEPQDIAKYFKEIIESKQYNKCFKKIIFSIYDKEPYKNFNTFKTIFNE